MRRFKAIRLVGLVALLVGSTLSLPGNTGALSGSEFNAGRIIDDAVFFNSNSMSVGEIQNFLNNKVDCDFDGSEMTGGITRAQYAAQRGYPTTFTCLPQYKENPSTKENNIGNPNYTPSGGQSAAQILYNASAEWGVSSKALIVLLQKEQSLITDEWPVPRQYQIATGYGCPDTAPCDEQYYGFYNQVNKAAYQFKRYVNNSSAYRYKAGQVNSIYWSPNLNCGASNVFIENGATAALYNYTPYRPNQAALNNLYGTGDGCSAYGNRNFWRMFRDWFGSTSSDPALYSAVVKDAGNGKVYLATSSKLHHIVTQEAADAWGIDLSSAQEPPSSYFTSRSEGPNLGSIAKDRFGNVFVMDGGERHYVQTAELAAIWGLNIQDAIQVDGFINSASDGRWLSACVQAVGGSDSWMGDTNVRHLIQSLEIAKAWGCNSATGMQASTYFIERLQAGGALGRFVQSGGKQYLVDSGSLWTSTDNVVGWYNANSESYFNCSTRLCATLPKKDLNWLVEDTSSGRWYVIEPGSKRYVKNGKIAKAWGFESFNPRSQLSGSLLNTLSNKADLGLSAKSTAPVKYYILGGGSKHYIPNQTAIDEWVPTGESIDTIDVAVLNKYSDGAALNTPLSRDLNGQHYIMQNGIKYPIESRKASSWSDSPVVASTKQTESMETGSAIGNTVYFELSGQKQYYAILGKKKYAANYNLVKNSWSLDQAIRIEASTLDRYNLQSASLSPLVRIAGKVYSLSAQKKKELSQYTIDKVEASKIIDLGNDMFDNSSVVAGSSYIIKDSGSSNIWLITKKGKVLLTSTAQVLNFGYISSGQELNILDIETIGLIPNDNTPPSLVVRSPSGSMKVVSFGGGLGFGDADSALAYIAVSGSVVDVSQSIFDSYGHPRGATRLIRDDNGKVYWLEAGKKRWILNGSLLSTTFNGIPQTYLHGTVMALIPDGPIMN